MQDHSTPNGSILASRVFSANDQARFASMSGDHNPIHIDPIAARRTYAGAPVVHGVHALLWLLDSLARHHPEIECITSLKAQLRNALYVGESADAVLIEHAGDTVRAKVLAGDAVAIELVATSAGEAPALSSPTAEADAPTLRRTAPDELQMDELQGLTGVVSFAETAARFDAEFPAAVRLLGSQRIAALGCASYVVGMLAPGLHSIFAALDLALTSDDSSGGKLSFAVTSIDPRFRRLHIQVTGGGLSGILRAFARVPPVPQPTMGELAPLVNRQEFRSSVALIIGGSRGLGEVTAKLLAAGGARVIVTYATGASDARSVASQISGWGGRCETARYDIRCNPRQQLRQLAAQPTHIFYFATPPIFRRRSGLASRAALDEFLEFYVHGFLELVEAAQDLNPSDISVFYPSSTAVQKRPPGMTAYAMAKAAGELLCEDLRRRNPGMQIVVQRLPRLLTDQTVSLTHIESANAVEAMLPVVRMMHRQAG